jgi:hypothetical protein
MVQADPRTAARLVRLRLNHHVGSDAFRLRLLVTEDVELRPAFSDSGMQLSAHSPGKLYFVFSVASLVSIRRRGPSHRSLFVSLHAFCFWRYTLDWIGWVGIGWDGTQDEEDRRAVSSLLGLYPSNYATYIISLSRAKRKE